MEGYVNIRLVCVSGRLSCKKCDHCITCNRNYLIFSVCLVLRILMKFGLLSDTTVQLSEKVLTIWLKILLSLLNRDFALNKLLWFGQTLLPNKSSPCYQICPGVYSFIHWSSVHSAIPRHSQEELFPDLPVMLWQIIINYSPLWDMITIVMSKMVEDIATYMVSRLVCLEVF